MSLNHIVPDNNGPYYSFVYFLYYTFVLVLEHQSQICLPLTPRGWVKDTPCHRQLELVPLLKGECTVCWSPDSGAPHPHPVIGLHHLGLPHTILFAISIMAELP